MTFSSSTISLVVVLIGPLFGVTAPVAAETKPSVAISADAAEAIRSVSEAARKRDFDRLRALMVEKFEWSFGGDSGAAEAISAWKTNPRYVRELQRVLRKGCRPENTDHITCPGRGGTSFRAGFIKTASGWRMEFFVEGD